MSSNDSNSTTCEQNLVPLAEHMALHVSKDVNIMSLAQPGDRDESAIIILREMGSDIEFSRVLARAARSVDERVHLSAIRGALKLIHDGDVVVSKKAKRLAAMVAA